MREALGQPLQNISRELLNKVVSKEVARDLRKYKYNVTGKTPSKENNRRPLSAEKNSAGGVASPSGGRRLNFGSPDNNNAATSKSPHHRNGAQKPV
jgi:hypothetical protein